MSNLSFTECLRKIEGGVYVFDIDKLQSFAKRKDIEILSV